MRILLFHQYFLEEDDPGGSRWNEMSRLWYSAGHEITVIAGMVHAHGFRKKPHYRGKIHCKTVQNGMAVHRVHVSEAYNRNFAGRLWGYFSYMFFSFWAALFKVKGKYDVIIATSPPLTAGIAAYLTAVCKRCAFVFEIRDLWPESAIDIGVLRSPFLIRLAFWAEAFLYRKAAIVVVLTPAFYRVLAGSKNVKPEKLLLVPNAADFFIADRSLSGFDRDGFREKLGFDKQFVVLYVGAHGVANGLDRLIEIAGKIQNEDVLFVLAGEGMEKEKLRKTVREKRVTNVKFLNAVSKYEVFKYIAAADLGVTILVKAETFKTVYSNKTFDYMACKLPVIMAIDGISRELIEEAKAGSYADPDNTDEFIHIINTYRKDPDRCRREGENGSRFVRKHFDRDKLAENFLRAIERQWAGESQSR